MAHLYWYLRALLGSLLSDDRAQDAFEYLLIAGVVVVAVIGAMVAFPNVIQPVIDAVQSAVIGCVNDHSKCA